MNPYENYPDAMVGRAIKQKNPGVYDNYDDEQIGAAIKAKYTSQATDPLSQLQQKQPGFVQSTVRALASPFLQTASTLGRFGEAIYKTATAKNRQELQQAESSLDKPISYGSYLGEAERFGVGKSPAETALQAFGAGLEIGSYFLGGGATAKSTALLKAQKGTKFLERAAPALLESTTAGTAGGLGIGLQQAAEMHGAPTEQRTAKAVKSMAIGTAAGIAAPFASRLAGKTIKTVTTPIRSTYKLIRSLFPPSQKMLKTEQTALEDAYNTVFNQREMTTKRVQFLKEQGKDPAKILGQHGLIPDIQYENGRNIMRTKGPNSAYEEATDRIIKRAEGIQTTLDNISQQAPNMSVAVDDIEQRALNRAIKESPGVDLKSIKNSISNAFEGVRQKYGDALSVGDINRLRIEANMETKAWNRPKFETDAFSVIGNEARSLIDDLIDDPIVREVNKEIADLISARKMLDILDGKIVGGGRFTNIISSAAGAVMGQITGKEAGVLGQTIGALVGMLGVKGFLRMLQQGAFGGVARKRILSYLADNPAVLNKLLEKEPEIIKNAFVKELQKTSQLLEKKALPSPSYIELPSRFPRSDKVDILDQLSKREAAPKQIKNNNINVNISDEVNNVIEELQASQAGSRSFSISDTGERQALSNPSTFPSWVPERLRLKNLFNKVIETIKSGQEPKPHTKESELYDLVMRQANKIREIDPNKIFGESYGALAGFEKDDNGNIKFNQQKAAVGIFALAGVKNIHPEDKAKMLEFIDHIAFKKPTNIKLELDISRISEKYNIPFKTLKGAAEKFKKIVDKDKRLLEAVAQAERNESALFPKNPKDTVRSLSEEFNKQQNMFIKDKNTGKFAGSRSVKETSLFEEARKYKSAEEFVNSSALVRNVNTPKVFEINNRLEALNKGNINQINLSELLSENAPEAYKKIAQEIKVESFYEDRGGRSPVARFVGDKETGRMRIEINRYYPILKGDMPDILNRILAEETEHALTFKGNKNFLKGSNDLTHESYIKAPEEIAAKANIDKRLGVNFTKSQLTDIWNQANK